MMRIDFDTIRRTLRRPWGRRLGLTAGVLVAGGVGLLALESRSKEVPVPDLAACCTGAVAVGDSMISPAVGGDKDFFEIPSSPPSAIFLLGNNDTMQDFPEYLPEVNGNAGAVADPSTLGPGEIGADGPAGLAVGTGCTDPALVSAMSWFDKGSADPMINGSIVYDDDADFGATPQFFDRTKFFQARGRRIAMVVNESPASLFWDNRSMDGTTDTTMACWQALNYKDAYVTTSPWSPLMTDCMSCLSTKGWWRGPIVTHPTDASYGANGPEQKPGDPPIPPEGYRKWVLSGRVLNVRPPKFVVARKVLKEVIAGAPNVRMGVATFGPDNGWFDPPRMLSKLRPSCGQSFPTINEDALDRPLLMKSVNQAVFRNNERSIGEALFGLGAYFSSQLQDGKWRSWFKQPLNPGWGWPGCCNGGTLDDLVYTGRTDGEYWAVQMEESGGTDEWLKGAQPWEEPWADNKSVCFSCQVNSVIVLTDGAPLYDNSVPITKMMELLKAKNAKHRDGTPLTFDPSDPENNTNPGGVNYCDQFEKAPGVMATKEDCDYVAWNWPTGLAKTNKNFMDDVAFFLANMDLRDDMPGTQSVRTYTIGYGDNNPMLQSIAQAGKGKFYRANNKEELRNSITDALGDLKQLSTSFASANLSTVQMSGMTSSLYVPRFIPRRGQPYEGHLYRFTYYSEFANDCDEVKAKGSGGDPNDKNQDKDCDDTFFLDKNDRIVQENVDGVWVRRDTATENAEGKLEGGTAAEPWWDLGETLGNRSAILPCKRDDTLTDGYTGGRCIFTLVDRNDDGKYTDADNPPIEFHENSLAITGDNIGEKLKNSLLSGGDSFCVTLFAKQNKGTWNGTAEDQKYCVTQLIRYVRGVNVFDLKSSLPVHELKDVCLDGSPGPCLSYKTERPCADNISKSCKLADIFHSSPVTVEPPAEPFLCTLGLSSQCVSTLYEDFSASISNEPLCASGGGGKPCYAPTPMDPPRSASLRYGAYQKYRDEWLVNNQDRIALVGSNGGMLHAIHVSSADKPTIGTGQEMWAFVPPDLLAKLGLMVNGHEYFVDGTPMVRDIWSDGNTDGVKQKDEFHTLAVVTERAGGQRYVGLDVTDPKEMLKVDGKPFRWMFPNSCDPVSASMGQSWSNFAPKPAPIGPVRLKATAGLNSDRGWEERWVTMLNGGYSPDLTRGRGVYMVDAWTGQTLWSAEAHPGYATGTAYDNLLNQMMPVVAAPALVDIGKAETVQYDLDGFFDTMVVGDMGGQVWTFRFWEPGVLDETTGRVTNWFGSRALEMARDDSSFAGPHNAYQKAPFFNMVSNVLQPETGWLRSFVGTGDRQHLRTTPGADCGPDDLLACIRLKCDVKAEYSADINGKRRTGTIEYSGGVLVTNDEVWNGTVQAACTSSKMELKELAISCPASAIGSSTYAATTKTESSCTKSGGVWSCTKANLNVSTHGDLKLSATDMKEVVANSYFGFHSYGGAVRNFRDAASAVAFDSLRSTDTPDFNCGTGKKCSLVDVTIPSSLVQTYTDASGQVVPYVAASDMNKLKRGETEGPGWFIRYNNVQERTAAGSTVLAGVVFWPSFAPSSGVGAAACSLSGAGDKSASWQADVITGLPDQAAGFRTSNGFIINKPRDTSSPPTEAPPTISLSKTSGIRYEVAVTNPGEAPRTEKLRDQKNVTPDVYWIEVPRNLHECRHENAGKCD